jgi:hypothetical protein
LLHSKSTSLQPACRKVGYCSICRCAY